MVDTALRAAARAWIDEDPDPETRRAGEALLAGGDEEALRDCYGSRLQFGTAGLRGPLGPGPNRMNRATVRRVTAGLADHLCAASPDAAVRGVVVGFDGRHGSRVFARDAASVLAGRGIPVHLYDRVVPTPELAFAVRHLGAAAGVMITASHNPPSDNGYKVYWDDGAQIVPPHDEAIGAAIDAVGSLADVAVPPLDRLRALGAVVGVDPSVRQAYVDAVLALRVHRATGASIVYTPLHGVGGDLVQTVLAAAGHTDVHVVAAQAEPDGDFPTVAFPNPEEPGALDLALALAEEIGADVVLANDPDADRLAVAVKHGGTFRILTGNEVGVLLADDLLASGRFGDDGLVATTIVSTAMLDRIAASAGVSCARTLTGFKWIARRAIAHEAAGGRFVLGFEEALGYCVGSVVRDKDGVSAALLVADRVSELKARGQTLCDHLEDLWRRHGLHLSAQHSLVLPGRAGRDRIRAVLARLRGGPPERLGDRVLVRVDDVLSGTSVDRASGRVSRLDLPRSDVLAFFYDDGSRILARPSGTEPKLKFYFEVVVPVADGRDPGEARAEAEAAMASLREAFLAVALAGDGGEGAPG